MTFTVTYRKKDGAKAEVEIEVASRGECVTECKARGIAPIGIREGRSGRAACGFPKRKRSPIYFYLFVAIVATATIALWCWVASRGSTPLPPEKSLAVKPKTEKAKATPPPKNVKPPEPAKIPEAPKADVKPTTKPEKEKVQTYFDERGIERYPGGMRVRRPAARTVQIEIDPLHRFKHTSEAQIAGLLEVKPGSMIVGDMKYSYRFVEDFKESLKEPIEILDTDSEYDKQLKRDVIETKKQLKAAMDRGEDIAQIMTDTRNELRKLGQYRDELKKELQKIHREGEYTDQDLEDLTAAANKMLEQRGCRPIKMPTLLIRYMREKQTPPQQNQTEEKQK